MFVTKKKYDTLADKYRIMQDLNNSLHDQFAIACGALRQASEILSENFGDTPDEWYQFLSDTAREKWEGLK